MKLLLLPLALVAAAPFVWTTPSVQSDDEIAEMMKAAAKYLEPGEPHQLLGKLIGEWETTSQITMGAEQTPPAPGRSTFSWKVDGRWVEGKFDGSMMGMPLTTYMWLGYDNFKQSYIWTDINNVDTAMKRAEGDLTPDGKTLILYGTLDEYLTGEHDKMVKYVWRFLSDDEFVLEVHDLPIGEVNTKVLEFRYTRSKGGK